MLLIAVVYKCLQKLREKMEISDFYVFKRSKALWGNGFSNVCIILMYLVQMTFRWMISVNQVTCTNCTGGIKKDEGLHLAIQNHYYFYYVFQLYLHERQCHCIYFYFHLINGIISDLVKYLWNSLLSPISNSTTTDS